MSDIPPWPGERPDYRNELTFARFSRVAYLDPSEILDPTRAVNPDYEELFRKPELYRRWNYRETRDLNGTTGLVMHVFTKDYPGKELVLAIRGSDNLADWTGPNVAVMRDGDLLELMNLPGPATRHTRAQFRRLQEILLPGDAWDPQFRDALDFAREVERTYGAQGYEIKVAGHSGGGAHGQVIAHTFGWEGRTFDAPGAANIIQSKGYSAWLAANGIEPAGVPAYRPDPFVSGFLNYTVNNSAVAYNTGPHLGQRQQISSYAGREGFGSKARHAAGIIGGGIGNTPLVGPALKLSGLGRLGTVVTTTAHGAQYGVDAFDRHDINRVVALFEEAVRRQDRGDDRPLPVLGNEGVRQGAPLADAGKDAGSDHPRVERASSPPVGQSGPPASAQHPMARFLAAAMSGEADAVREAARELCDGSGAHAWLAEGFARLDAQQGRTLAPGQEATPDLSTGVPLPPAR